MIGYPYIQKPLSGERSKQIAKTHPQQSKNSGQKPKVKLPDKFSVEWK